MAVTANQIMKRQDGCRRSLPVEEATTIYEGTAVFVNAAGYADDDTATGVNGFAGIAIKQADNSTGGDGDANVEVWADGDFEITSSGLTQADVGSTMYATDNFTFSLTAGAAGVAIGRIVRLISATKAIVSIKTTGTGAAQTAALTTIAIADAEGTPDYAITSFTNSTAWGFASEQELITFAYVVKNAQERLLQLEAKLN